MEEKITKLDTEELGRDLQSVQALQRRHENIERELAPLEERVNRINHLATSYVLFLFQIKAASFNCAFLLFIVQCHVNLPRRKEDDSSATRRSAAALGES